VLDSVSLVVHAGEVLGIAGVEGNGQTELVETIMAMRQAASGRVRWVMPAPKAGRWT